MNEENIKFEAQNSAKFSSNLEKLQSLGRLVSGITHEINTPMHYLENNLTFLRVAFKDIFGLIDLYQQLLSRSMAGEPVEEKDWQILQDLEQDVDPGYLRSEITQALDQSIEGIDMVSRIVLALKDFSHPGLHEFSLTDINKCVDTVCVIARHEWKRVADLHLDLASDLPFLFCSRDEIHQVVLNLVVNAAQAISQKIQSGDYDRGNIFISTANCGELVEIKIRDDGPGISEANQALIFKENFTTKPAGSGTGFGLGLVRRIVEQRHGGKISFSTVPGRETVFSVLLPHRPDESQSTKE